MQTGLFLLSVSVLTGKADTINPVKSLRMIGKIWLCFRNMPILHRAYILLSVKRPDVSIGFFIQLFRQILICKSLENIIKRVHFQFSFQSTVNR